MLEFGRPLLYQLTPPYQAYSSTHALDSICMRLPSLGVISNIVSSLGTHARSFSKRSLKVSSDEVTSIPVTRRKLKVSHSEPQRKVTVGVGIVGNGRL